MDSSPEGEKVTQIDLDLEQANHWQIGGEKWLPPIFMPIYCGACAAWQIEECHITLQIDPQESLRFAQSWNIGQLW